MTPTPKKQTSGFERIGDCLYRKGDVVYARVRLNGKATWRSTGTNLPKEARAWLKKWREEGWMLRNGFEPKCVVLRRERATVGELIDTYVEAGCPTKKMQPKSPVTVRNERFFLSPVKAYFGSKPAGCITLADCDKYRDWRLSGGYISTFKLQGGKPRTIRTSGGNRSVDLELTVLSNVFNLAVRRNSMKVNPFAGRGRYTIASDVRHCREVAPTPETLKQIEQWLRERNEHAVADLLCFLALSGLRIGEALPLTWDAVNWGEQILDVKRQKRGIYPWVPIGPDMEGLLREMEQRAQSRLLFPAPFDPMVPRDASAVRNRIKTACKKLKIAHVTPHGLRSYFVTQARQSGLTDAEIAMLIGDKTGPAIIAHTYGDIRAEHLAAQARRIEFSTTTKGMDKPASSIKSSITLPDVSPSLGELQKGHESAQTA